jgi:hypothetical protein
VPGIVYSACGVVNPRVLSMLVSFS